MPLAEPAEQVVPQPDIQREIPRDPIVVLNIEAPVIIALVRSMVCAGPAALIHRAEQKLCQAVPSQARHRVVGEPAAEAEVIAPAREIPVAIAAPHQTGLQGVRANDFRYVVQNREGIFALDRVLPLLRPEAG